MSVLVTYSLANGPVALVPTEQLLTENVTSAPSSRLPLASYTVTTTVERLTLVPTGLIRAEVGLAVTVAWCDVPMHSTSIERPSSSLDSGFVSL